jgi:hypothetical protein
MKAQIEEQFKTIDELNEEVQNLFSQNKGGVDPQANRRLEAEKMSAVKKYEAAQVQGHTHTWLDDMRRTRFFSAYACLEQRLIPIRAIL